MRAHFLSFFLLAALCSSAKAAEPRCEPAPAIREMLDTVEKAGNSLDHMTKENVGTLWLTREASARSPIAEIPLAKTEDRSVPARNHQIPVRIYTPKETAPFKKGALPVVVYYHGGGWTLGSLAAYEQVTRELARKIPAIVISVDYRLAPEQPFPAASDDAYLALEWAARNAKALGGDPKLLAVAGDSAGGNLATVAARKAAAAKMPLALEALFYPSVDLGHTEYDSYKRFGEGYLLTKKSVEDFRAFYVPNQSDWENPDAAPFRASAPALAKLPRTLFVLPGCDPLRDEGLAYAEKLKANGVPVRTEIEAGMVHGFLNFFNLPAFPRVSAAVAPLIDRAASLIRAELRTAH